MYSVIQDKALAIIAKSGTQSFSDVGANWYVTNEQALIYSVRVMFIRDPFERLLSCYSFFVQLRDEGTKYSGFDYAILSSWELFIDYMLVNPDEHWTPQTDSVLCNGEFTPTDVLAFDDVAKWFPIYFDAHLKHLNKSVKQAVDESYRLEDVQKYYAKDFEVYSTARKYKMGDTWPLQ